MDKLRLVYEQTRRAIWMSHLDTMRTLQRAIKRAGIPIRYSEGFNPHELISILLPLSVGTASLCQIADIRVREDVDIAALPAQLTAVMPEGIRVTDCYENAMKPAELLTAAVRTHLPDCAPDGGRFCRTALYRADGTPYR